MALLHTALDSILYVLPFLIVITLIVFIHELGHYLAARANGVDVESFSIGFGPELFGWNDRKGTRWKVSLVPLGGYIKMSGDADVSSKADYGALSDATEEERARFIHTKKPWQRMIVAAAGPIANFLLTIVLLALVIMFFGKKEADPVVGGLVPGGVAEHIGLKVGDQIKHIDVLNEEGNVISGTDIDHFRTVKNLTNKNAGNVLRLTVERAGESLVVEGRPETMHVGDKKELAVGVLGVKPLQRTYPFFQAIIESVKVTWDLGARTLKALIGMIVGREDAGQLGGLFMLAKGANDFLAQGLGDLLEFMAIISLNLGLINLFPIPMLDGGHIVFYLVEAVRGKPASEAAQEWAYRIGFFVLIGVMLFSHWNDVVRYGWVEKILSFFG